MDKETLKYSIIQALDCEFTLANYKRKLEIYKTSKELGYTEQSEEMREEINLEYNIKIN